MVVHYVWHWAINLELVGSVIVHSTITHRLYAVYSHVESARQDITRDLALVSMARDDPPVARQAARPQCAVKWDRNLEPKLLAIMRQCTSVTDRRTDRRTLTSYHKREMHILHLALIKCNAVIANSA